MGRKNRAKRNKKKGTKGAGSRQQENGVADAEARAGVPSSDAAPSAPYGPGTRVICHGAGRGCPLGTVVPLFGMAMAGIPIMIRLDCGTGLFLQHDDDVQTSKDPPLLATFDVGARVECQLFLQPGGPHPDLQVHRMMPSYLSDWEPGTVVRTDNNWVMAGFGGSPYMIRFDSKPLTEPPSEFWGPNECIRASTIPAPDSGGGLLKYNVGSRVKCNIGQWAPGTVIKQWHHEESLPSLQPYQVQLDDGSLIFVPFDREEMIQPSTTPPPECWMCMDNKQTPENLILRACNCRGEGGGFGHVKCFVQLALHKVDTLSPKVVNPFWQCITCKSPFDLESLIAKALAKAQYAQFANESITSPMNKEAFKRMVGVKMREKDYSAALLLLTERISQVEDNIEENRPYFHTGNSETKWKTDLAGYLSALAEVHKELGSMDEMRSLLDKLFLLLDYLSLSQKSGFFQHLAEHSYTAGDKSQALIYLEKSLDYLSRVDAGAYGEFAVVHFDRLSTSLLMCGNLNLELHHKEKGVRKIVKAIKILAKNEGKSPRVVELEKQLAEIREGTREKLPARAGKLDVHGVRS